ncbi:MAG TPA: hypothetical protein VGP93_12255 [Polyangiaceae bacterium]|nr:hypothetical protein [Polyangiaceae bacterium]
MATSRASCDPRHGAERHAQHVGPFELERDASRVFAPRQRPGLRAAIPP